MKRFLVIVSIVGVAAGAARAQQTQPAQDVQVSPFDGARQYVVASAKNNTLYQIDVLRVNSTVGPCLLKTRSDFADDEFSRKRYSDCVSAKPRPRRQTRESTISSISRNCDSVPVETRRVREIIVATMRPRGRSDSAVR